MQDAELVAADFLKQLRIVEHFDETVDRRVARFFGDADSEVDEGTHVLFDTVEQSATAGEDDTTIIDISGDFGTQLGKRVFGFFGNGNVGAES